MQQKIVVHHLDGTIRKGISHDFDGSRPEFHLLPAEGGGVPQRVAFAEVKAVFFVRDYLGNPEYDPPEGFGPQEAKGRRCVVRFRDGEVIYGSTADHDDEGPGFTLEPSDPDDNNARIYVNRDAVVSVEFPG